MKWYQPAQIVSILACTVLASTVVLTSTLKRNDIGLPPPPEEPRLFTAVVTAYSSSPDETWGDPFITASGRRVHDGVVACPRAYPFGTRVRLGSQVFTCWDRLHKRFDDRFDIWKPSKQDAVEFGKQVLPVEVL